MDLLLNDTSSQARWMGVSYLKGNTCFIKKENNLIANVKEILIKR